MAWIWSQLTTATITMASARLETLATTRPRKLDLTRNITQFRSDDLMRPRGKIGVPGLRASAMPNVNLKSVKRVSFSLIALACFSVLPMSAQTNGESVSSGSSAFVAAADDYKIAPGDVL